MDTSERLRRRISSSSSDISLLSWSSSASSDSSLSDSSLSDFSSASSHSESTRDSIFGSEFRTSSDSHMEMYSYSDSSSSKVIGSRTSDNGEDGERTQQGQTTVKNRVLLCRKQFSRDSKANASPSGTSTNVEKGCSDLAEENYPSNIISGTEPEFSDDAAAPSDSFEQVEAKLVDTNCRRGDEVQNRRSDEQKFVCDWENCKKAYRQISHLTRHTRHHIPSNQTYGCTFDGCDKRFIRKDYLDSHLRNRHPGFEPMFFKCKTCRRMFTVITELIEHSGAHKNKIYPCKRAECNLTFSSQVEVKKHRRTSHPYRCTWKDCTKLLADKHTLRRHIESVHQKIKIFKCDWKGCKESFAGEQYLLNHRRTHTGENPFRCREEGCTKSFAQKYHLAFHGRTHKSEKPYRCLKDGCGKCFARSGDLLVHKKYHAQLRQYKCGWNKCEQAFVTSFNLKRHMKTHTNKK